MTIKVMVADDQDLVRAGFTMMLNSQPDISVVAEAGTGRQAVDAARRLRPDVALMDIRMPEMDGLEATRVIKRENEQVRVLILTTFDPDEYVYEALRAGASGFVLKDMPPTALIDGVRAVARGEALLSPTITKRLIERFARQSPREESKGLERLTERELDVLRHVARGQSNAEIADALFISATTVKSHISSVLSKLHLRDRVHAVVFAYEHGLIRPGEDS